jgi:hypothetical protein
MGSMLQVYFLSILLNILCGYLFAFSGDETEMAGLSFHLDNETVRLVIGVLSLLTGILKILSPVEGNVPVVGDLVPALGNLAGGFILVFEFYRNRSTVDSLVAERIGEIIEKNRKLTGFVCLAAGVLHFIFYSVLFL